MGRCSFGRKVVGQFSRSRIVKFGVTATSDASEHRRNRSGAIELPSKAVVTGAPACELEPEGHPSSAHPSADFFLSRAARGR